MPKISTYNTTTPKLDDKLIGTDVDNNKATKNFTIADVIALVPGGISSVQSLNSLVGALDIVAGNPQISVTTNGSNQIIISTVATGGNYLEDVFVTNGVAQLGVILTVPEGAVSLTDSFAALAKIIEVSFPSTLTSISDNAFSDNLLTEIDLNQVNTVGNRAFLNNAYLENLNLSSVQTIGEYAFRSTGFLGSGYDLVFPSTLTSLGIYVFLNSKINSVTFDASNQITILPIGVFNNSTGFTSINLPSNLITIGDGAFYGTDLTSIIVPNSVTSIGDAAFEFTNLTSAVINNGTIGNRAFQNLSTLTSLTLNSGVTSIGTQAFLNSGITTVTIPSTVTSMGTASFNGSLSLTSAIINSTVIGVTAFANSTLLSTVTLSNNLLSIGSSAFGGTGLTSITIPNTVTSLGASSFQDTYLSSIVFDSVSQITDIPQSCFKDSWENTRTVTTLTLPEAVQTFGQESFQQAGIQTLAIPNTTTTIDESAFFGQRYTTFAGTDPALDWTDAVRRGLNTLTFDATSVLTTIGGYAFKYNALTSVTIPSSVTFIGIDAFRYNNLTSVILPASVTTIGNDSFSNNPNLTDVTINSTQINTSQAFDNIAPTITTVNIGPGVTAASGIFTGSTGIGTLDIAANAVTNSFSFDNFAIGTLTVDGTATINSSSFTSSTITLGTIGNGITLPDSAFLLANFTTLNIGDNLTTGNNSFDDVTIGTMTIGNNAEIVGGTFDAQSSITNLTIGENSNILVSAFSGLEVLNNLTIGDDATILQNGFSSVDVGGGVIIGDNAVIGAGSFQALGTGTNLTIGDDATISAQAFQNGNISGNVTIGDDAIIENINNSTSQGVFYNTSILGSLSIGVNADIQSYSFRQVIFPSTITNLTIGSGSSLGEESLSYHPYLSFSLGNNLTFGRLVFRNATLTGNFTIDPTWTLVQDSLDLMNIIGDFIVPNNEVLPISVFSEGSIDGDLVLGTGVTLSDDCFFSTDITGDLTIPISTVFTGNQHFENANIGTVNIPDNFVLVDQMFDNVTVGTMTLGNNITIPNLLVIDGTITNMTVGDNLIGTFISQSNLNVTNMVFGSNNTLKTSTSAVYSNLTIGLNNTFETSAFNSNQITTLIMPAPVNISDTHQFNGSGFFQSNNISSLPAYFSSSFVDTLQNSIFRDNAFSGNITFPSNLTIFDSYCFSNNSLTGITNASPAYSVFFGDGVFQNNNFTAIPDFLEGIITGILPNYTFENNSFTSLTIDATNSPWVKKISTGCFRNNSLLTTLSFDAANTNHASGFIDNQTFFNCNISSITFLATGTGSWDVNTCTSNSNFKGNNLSTLPTGLFGTGSVVGQAAINYEMFMDNSFSGSLTIPDGVTDIGTRAFKNNNLTDVSVAAGTTIDADAFDPGVTITFRP